VLRRAQARRQSSKRRWRRTRATRWRSTTARCAACTLATWAAPSRRAAQRLPPPASSKIMGARGLPVLPPRHARRPAHLGCVPGQPHVSPLGRGCRCGHVLRDAFVCGSVCCRHKAWVPRRGCRHGKLLHVLPLHLVHLQADVFHGAWRAACSFARVSRCQPGGLLRVFTEPASVRAGPGGGAAGAAGRAPARAAPAQPVLHVRAELLVRVCGGQAPPGRLGRALRAGRL